MTIPFIPAFRHTDQGKKLFNPVLKKRYENRPEERVRLGLLEQLLQLGKWPIARVGFEIRAPHEVSKELRTDIIAFDSALKPKILIECKSPEIPINQHTVQQAFRYNQDVQADWIVLSNGRTTISFNRQKPGDAFEQTKNHPFSLRIQDNFSPLESAFWISRAFIDESAPEIAIRVLNTSFKYGSYVHWLDLPYFEDKPSFSHYFKAIDQHPGHWLSVVATDAFSTWLVEINANQKPATLQAFNLNQNPFSDTKTELLSFNGSHWQKKLGTFKNEASIATLQELKDFLL